MSAVRVLALLSVIGAGPAFGADKPTCDLLTRPQVASVVGAGAIGTQYLVEELPLRRKSKEPTRLHTCAWSVKETQSAVEVQRVVAPLDTTALEFAFATLTNRAKRHQDDEQDFNGILCWSELKPNRQFPYAACVANVKGNMLKVQFRSNTGTPTILQAKLLFDQAMAGI